MIRDYLADEENDEMLPLGAEILVETKRFLKETGVDERCN